MAGVGGSMAGVGGENKWVGAVSVDREKVGLPIYLHGLPLNVVFRSIT